jgi:dTDP-4-dehydrorhamnose reductase
MLRVSWVFGIYGHNFVKTILRLAREREELRIVADQYGGPTYAGDIADVLLTLAGRIAEIDANNAWGIYHYCGQPATTWYGFAKAIVEEAGHYEVLRVKTITPIATADYPTPAARPANSVLDCGKLTARFGIQQAPWQAGLQSMLLAIR